MSDAVVEKNTFEQLEKSIEKKIQKDTISNENKTLLKKENARKNDGNKVKAKTFSPNTSLDKVAQDIRNILGQLKVNESQKKKKSPIQLKVEQKEFFRAETARKMRAMKQNLARKKTPQNTRRNTSAVCFHKVSRNSIKIASSSKIRSKSLLKPGNLCTIHSNQLLKKIPITISEMNDFKHRVALSANAVSKHPVILKAPEKEKIEKEIKTLVEIASVKSEHTHKVPIIDVGSFINKSLELTTSNDFPGLKKIIEKKTKNLESETGSESEYSEKSIRRLKVEVKPKEKENPKENEATEKNNTIKEPKKDVQKKASLSRRNEDISKSKLASIQPVVQTLKTLPNSGYTNRAPARSSFIQSQSRTTGSLIMHQKSVPFKSTIQKSQVPQKIIPKTNSTLVSSNKPVVPRSKPPVAKQNLSEKPQSKVVNQTGSNINAKSNSALGATISVVKKSHTVHVENPVATLNKTSSSANNSYTSRYTGAFRRRDSVDSTQRRLMSAPTRTLSSISSRLLNGRKYNHFGMGASSHSYFDRKSSTLTANKRSADPIVQLRDEVNRCIRDKKTFTVRGNFPAVRRALLRRGWIEKYHTTNRERLQSEMNTLKNKSVNELVNMLHMKELNEICKKLIKSKLLGNHQVDLYWGPNFESFQINSDKVKLTKINKFRRDVFSYTSKQGLCDAAKNAHWFNFPGLAHIKHPRTYALAKNGETRDFIKDFRRTSAMSLLKWIIKNHQTKECKLISSSGKIPLEAFQFAANECYKMVIEATNQDIDQPLKEATDNEWKQFLEYYYKILHIGNHFKSGNLENVDTLVEKSTFLINKLVPHYPHIKMDGTMNIWILKPAAGSQGRGIHICRTLQYIMDTIQTNTHTHYIAQKYIERPLLIFNTKFDIRQWFLISSSQPLTIWMYKECYLRFSSQTYNLRKLHESIHLTNNSVQQRYKNTTHDITLPNYNMWDSNQFKNYLSNIGYPEIFRKTIYKGMRECIIGAVMIHQDKIDHRKNCFELYGADFMLTEDFQPWLIEINSSPALYASTPITSRMCPQVLEDTIKVVVDHASDPKAKTGNFELIYRQPQTHCNNNANMSNLKISGKPLPNNYFCLEEDKNAKRILPLSITENLELQRKLIKSEPEIVAKDVQETLENLLKFIQSEKKRRQNKKMETKGTDPIELLDAKIEEKRSSCTTTSLSLSSLKSQLDMLSAFGDISMSKEEENLIDHTLKMLKHKRTNEVVRYLFEIIERMICKTPQIET